AALPHLPSFPTRRSSDLLPGHEKWTYGGARGIFAESPNRVFMLGGGELPKMGRPKNRLLTDVGPNVQFPIAGLPWRNANTASPRSEEHTSELQSRFDLVC